MTKNELELKNKSLEEEIEKLNENIKNHVTEKQYLAHAVEAKDKEISMLKLKVNDMATRKDKETKELAREVSDAQNDKHQVELLKRQLEVTRKGEITRAKQLEDLMKLTSNFLNSLQPQIENNVNLFNMQMEQIANTFKPKGDE